MGTSESKKGGIWMILAIIFFITTGVFLGMWIASSNKASEQTEANTVLTAEKNDMISKLEALQKKYDQLSEENQGLDEMFEKEKANVENLLKKIKASQGSVEKYKVQVSQLEARLKEYEQQIEQLKSENKDLTAQNFTIKTKLDSTATEVVALQGEKAELTEIVNKGSVLTVYDMIANGIRMSGKKEVPTPKSKRAEKLRICLTLGENAIATAGKKDVYVRISDPSKKVLCKATGDEYSFMSQGTKLQYTIKETINYQNKAIDLCTYWDKAGEFVPGSYIVDVFVDEVNIGSTNLIFEK